MTLSFKERFKIIEKIGKGSFGNVYKGFDSINNEYVAIKIEDREKHKNSTISKEVDIYKKISKSTQQNISGIPELLWYGKHKKYYVMVINYLGNSLENIFNKSNKKFSLDTVLLIADKLLNLLEHLHNMGILHRDIKPDNFVLGVKNKNEIYMIDYGLSINFMTGEKHKHYREDKSLIGTLRYASIRNHLGIEQSRRDDLESLGYMLLYFLLGKLPWQGLKSSSREEKYKNIKLCKITYSLKKLCQDVPIEFYEYLCYCRNLKYSEKPDYQYLKNLFRNLYNKKKFHKSKQLQFNYS